MAVRCRPSLSLSISMRLVGRPNILHEFHSVAKSNSRKCLSCGQPVCWAHKFLLFVELEMKMLDGMRGWVGRLTIIPVQQAMLEFFLHVLLVRSSGDRRVWISLAQTIFQMIDQGRLTGLAINSDQGSGWH